MEELISLVNDPDVVITSSGIFFNFMKPQENQVFLSDISYALSNINRWGGHHRQQISVARHSINVCNDLRAQGYSADIQLQGLMHDASEAYIGDISRPIKSKLPLFYEIEESLMHVIARALNFDWPMLPEVKIADDKLLRAEWDSWNNKTDIEIINSQTTAMEFEREYYRLRLIIDQENNRL